MEERLKNYKSQRTWSLLGDWTWQKGQGSFTKNPKLKDEPTSEHANKKEGTFTGPARRQTTDN